MWIVLSSRLLIEARFTLLDQSPLSSSRFCIPESSLYSIGSNPLFSCRQVHTESLGVEMLVDCSERIFPPHFPLKTCTSKIWRFDFDGSNSDVTPERFAPKKTITLLGDSTMSRQSNFWFIWRKEKNGARCGNVESYFGLEAGNPVFSELYGPSVYGLDHPGCSDCDGCSAWKGHVPMTNASIEYVNVEFAKDVEFVSKDFSFSQETVMQYLKLARSNPDLILVNAGLHDMNYVWKTKRVSVYTENVRWYLSLLFKSFPNSKIVWITTNSVKDSETPPDDHGVSTRNRAFYMNQQVLHQLVPLFPNLEVVDVFEFSDSPLGHDYHDDFLHMKPEFYRRLRNFVINLGCKSWNLCSPVK